MKKIKLLLLQPPVQDFYETSIRLQPIGLAYLKATVEKYLPHVEVIIRDYHQKGRRTLSLPSELSYLKDYYPWPDTSPFSTFHHYYHFGASFESLADDVARLCPDLVGISSLFSPYYREVLRSAEEIKKRLPLVPILLGGSHVSAMPRFMLNHPYVDFVIQGEGERPLVKFLKAWESGGNFSSAPNLGYKKDGALVLNRKEENFPMEDIPVPDFSHFPPGAYLFEGRPMAFVMTSRGCPHRCSFCSVHLTFDKGHRKRSASGILDEILLRYKEGYRVFDFEDDHLFGDLSELRELCHKLKLALPPGRVRLTAMNGVSYFHLDKDSLLLLREAGFTHLNLSLVSAGESLQQAVRRPHSLGKFLAVVEEAHRLGFKMVSYQILGLPHEDREAMIRTLILLARLPVLLGASIFYLTPGAPLSRNYPEPTKADILKSRLTAMAVEGEGFQREDLYTLFVTARIVNFIKGLTLQEGEMTLEDLLCAARREEGRTARGVEILKRLFEEGCLHAWTSQGMKPLSRFDSSLFFQVWKDMNYLLTPEGKRIVIRKGNG